MKSTLIVALSLFPAVSFAAVSETLSAGAVRSFSLSMPEARFILASAGDADLRGELYGLAASGIELEKKWNEAIAGMNKEAQDALGKANANAKAGSAAQAFKNEALRLRSLAAGLSNKTATLTENIRIYQVKLGSDTVKAAQKLLAQVKGLEQGVDALVDAADEIAKKS